MQWIAPSEKDAATSSLENRLWAAADQFRANSGLKAQEYSGPILDTGLPRAFTPELYRAKCSAVFEHVYESYPERNAGVYSQAM